MSTDQAPRVGQDVANSHASANPGNYSEKYRFDVQEGRIVHKDPLQAMPKAFNHIQFAGGDDGKLEAYVPALASGRFGLYAGISDPLNWNNSDFGSGEMVGEFFGRWDPVLNNNDYKYEMRKAIMYWKIDPLYFRCTKLMSQLANSAVTISCENEQFKEMCEMWFHTAMNYNFRRFWFMEFFRTGFVPVLKTLIPYVPRDYKPGKVPNTNSEGNIDSPLTSAFGERAPWNTPPATVQAGDPAESLQSVPTTPEQNKIHDKLAKDTAQTQKTMKLSQESVQAYAEYKEAYRLFEQARSNKNEFGLCSQERLDFLFNIVTAKQYKWLKGAIPGAYTILDPLYVEMWGPHEMGWLREPYLNVSGELIKAILNPTVHQEMILSQLPIEIIAQVRGGMTRVWLSPNVCTVCTGDRQPYERYPTPFIAHAFKALDMKYELYEMDRATVRQVKTRILKVTIGNDTFPAFDPGELDRLARVFAAPGRNMHIFWNHTLAMEWVEPNLDSLKDPKKYNHWNDEIRMTFGVSRILTGTSETSGAASVMNFKGVEEFIEEAQQVFIEFAKNEIRMLKASLGVSAEVEVKFDRLNLQDEVKYMAVLNQAVINGLIDHETAIETLKFHFPTIVSRMKKIKAMQDKDHIFMPQPSANNMGPDGVMSPMGGKPPNKPLADNNANKKGTSQPKTKASAKMVDLNGSVGVVMNTQELDQEQRSEVAEFLHIEPDMVLTVAEYESQYHKKVDFTPPLPELTMMETMAVCRDAEQAIEHIHGKYNTAMAEFKEANKGKRGPYVTDAIKSDFMEKAMATRVKPLPEDQKAKVLEIQADLKTQQLGIPDEHIGIYAQFIYERRLGKLRH